MSNEASPSTKDIDTREWYNFVGLMSEHLPAIHLGGQQATQRLLALCQIEANDHVLDVGCGPGHTACLIGQQFGARVMGVDISEVMVEQARRRALAQNLTERVRFRTADAFELPFDDQQFDLALTESVLTPLAGDKERAMEELVRVVRPGGRVAANESTLASAAPPEMLALMREHPATHGHFTDQTLRDLFEQAGLEVLHLERARIEETPSAFKEMGIAGLLRFMFRVYPKILTKLLRDARFRRASQIDDQLTKRYKKYMGYALIVGQTPE